MQPLGPLILMLIALATSIAGCAAPPSNPSFPVSPRDARRILSSMAAEPRPLARPLVIVGGYHDIGLGPAVVGGKLRRVIRDDDDRGEIVHVAVGYTSSFDASRRALIATVDEACGRGDGADATVDVDVIGLSMGGLVARYAAMPIPGERRLRIVRLFTISSPHGGARLAETRMALGPALDERVQDMAPGSAFLRALERAEADGLVDHELIPYVRLGDTLVGPEHAAPAGVTPWWVSTPMLQPAHVGAAIDDRILADIARRLRGEPPLTSWPPAPLPHSAN